MEASAEEENRCGAPGVGLAGCGGSSPSRHRVPGHRFCQVLRRDVQVHGGRLQRRVSEQLLQDNHVDALAEQHGREGVAELVQCDPRTCEPSPRDSPSEDAVKLPSRKGPPGARGEQAWVFDLRPHLQPALQCRPRRPAQGHDPAAPSLSVNDSKRAHLQVGVVQRQPDQLGATQAGEEQQGDDGSIPECDQREPAVLRRVEEEQALLHRQRLGRRARSSG